MTQAFLIPLLEGIAAGAVVAATMVILFYRRQRRAAGDVLAEAQADAERLRQQARREAEVARTDALLEAKTETLRLREELERDLAKRREELERQERRYEDRGRELDRRAGELGQERREVERRGQQLAGREAALAAREGEAARLVAEQRVALERAAGLSSDEARRELLRRVEDEARSEAAALAREIREEARKQADREAKRLIAMAIQRSAAETTAETTVATVTLPSDELKGRIIGREGRNIRAFEAATGVDVIIDDTPDSVVISCFDPVRREVARRALGALVADGRIHPGRIEEVVARVQKELEAEIVELGERAVYETGIAGMHPELVRLVGRMRYRTSYGQNILDHSLEVARLAGAMAAELGVDVKLARRGALLHDVGKVLTHDSEGTHVELGVEVARRYGEPSAVIGCIAAHHDDVPHETTESVLVQAADAISGSRPGARRESFETYVKRLTKLEEIAHGFGGVEKANVIQAGREVRVIVTPEQVGDRQAAELAEQIARRIEDETQYPGQIRVVVIRETRATGVAR